MNAQRVKKYILNRISESKKDLYYPRSIFYKLGVEVYSGSFGWITIRIESKYAFVSGYVGNYNAVDEKINDFIENALFNLYENCYISQHKKRAR